MRFFRDGKLLLKGSSRELFLQRQDGSIFSFVFSIYIDNFSNFSYMYGSLTAIVLAMLWLYICMQIVLIGAEINVFLNDDENDITPIQPLASKDK